MRFLLGIIALHAIAAFIGWLLEPIEVPLAILFLLGSPIAFLIWFLRWTK